MEDLSRLLQLTETYPTQLEQMTEEFLSKLRLILWGQTDVAANDKEKFKDVPAASPQQKKKRVKRLSLLTEDNEIEENLEIIALDHTNDKKLSQKGKRSNSELLAMADDIQGVNKQIDCNTRQATTRSVSELSSTRENEKDGTKESLNKSGDINTMPPSKAPIVATEHEITNKRPQRAAKIKSEKNLKEPKLITKLRQPTTSDVKIKLEHEQRQSQMYENTNNKNATKNTLSKSSNNEIRDSVSSHKSDDSVFVLPAKQPSTISINSDIEDLSTTTLASNNLQTAEKQKKCTDNGTREMCIKIKREKVSLGEEPQEESMKAPSDEGVFKVPKPIPQPMSCAKKDVKVVEETSLTSSMLSSTTNTSNAVTTKKTRKKKEVHKPIKVERFSDLDPKPSPISSRTRHCSFIKTNNDDASANQETERSPSIYEDALETASSSNLNKVESASANGVINNETVDVGPPADATFCTNPAQTTFQVASGQTTFVVDSNLNGTVTLNKHSDDGLADATFDINPESKTTKDKENDAVGQRSFETAKDSSMPNDAGISNEYEQEKPTVPKSKVAPLSIKAKAATKTLSSAKTAYKVPTRTNELFNPLAQSPVKMRVEAFENAAAAAAEQSKRPLRSRKENITPTSASTPDIAKLTAPALGRFLTPTQTSNVAAFSSAIAKKGATSASKALPKSGGVSSLIRSNSAVSAKTLPHESGSSDDFRKGLHNLAEERKKQREQKHLLVAQQREAKERERAERIAKLTKEREEKRLFKKQEQEQKKRELDEIQRKLRQQEEAAKLKAAKEREIMQMKQHDLAKPKMMPPPPKIVSKYTFEMLHEYDSTDDEDKVSHKRPPPPSWSRRHVRGPIMLKQEYTPSAYIDSFFSVQPMTIDLKAIFPNIDARHLKRNSSVFWSTPPRYSELPKY